MKTHRNKIWFRAVSLLLFLGFSLLIEAQNFRPEWNVGINGGINLPSISFVPSVRTKTMQTPTFGVGVRYISEKHLGIQGELNYSGQGFTQGFGDNDSLYSYSRNLNYIELPIMTHIYFGNKIRYFVNLGPKVAYMVSSRERLNTSLSSLLSSGDSTSLSVYEHFEKSIDRRFDYGLVMGMGMELRSKIGNFLLEGRYYLGLGDIFSNSRSDYFSRSAHRVFSVKMTYFVRWER